MTDKVCIMQEIIANCRTIDKTALFVFEER
jgi:hypothetical protein